jgi:ABC-type polysaccharide/polyol phosphate export permease
MANPYSDNAPGKAFWFVVINGSLLNIWGINVFATISDIHRDRWTGMLAATRLSVTPLLTLFIIRALTNTIHGLVSLLIFATYAWLLYQPEWSTILDIRIWSLVGLSFMLIAAFSLLFATIIAMSAHSHHIMNFIEYPVFILAGIGFTVGLLPPFMQWFALALPFGFSAEFARSLAGISLSHLAFTDILWLPVLGAIVIGFIGLHQMNLMERTLAETGNVR